MLAGVLWGLHFNKQSPTLLRLADFLANILNTVNMLACYCHAARKQHIKNCLEEKGAKVSNYCCLWSSALCGLCFEYIYSQVPASAGGFAEGTGPDKADSR